MLNLFKFLWNGGLLCIRLCEVQSNLKAMAIYVYIISSWPDGLIFFWHQKKQKCRLAIFLLKSVGRLGQCHPEKLTMPVLELNEETVVWPCMGATAIVIPISYNLCEPRSNLKAIAIFIEW
ncbi:hypothetical protein [Pedobacter sp. N23S346]|uniref:hypothetical protein n=1 Tax=Pedobacter sp. N23S346 TaxID=3402750 RepID=UPI003AD49E24